MKNQFLYFLALLLVPTLFFMSAQERLITGVVTSKTDGFPLPGVNVIVKGTTTETQTDFDGLYEIKAKRGDILVFSYIGMKTKELRVGSKNTINVKLEDDSEVLEEVVVTGYDSEVAAPFRKVQGVRSLEDDSEELEELIIEVNEVEEDAEAPFRIIGSRESKKTSAPVQVRGVRSIDAYSKKNTGMAYGIHPSENTESYSEIKENAINLKLEIPSMPNYQLSVKMVLNIINEMNIKSYNNDYIQYYTY